MKMVSKEKEIAKVNATLVGVTPTANYSGPNNLNQSAFDEAKLSTPTTSFALACYIDNIIVENISICDADNTFDDPQDDSFTADVTVVFNDIPNSGTLELTGDGSASVTVSSIVGFSHTFTGVEMGADGGDIFLTASFSDESPPCPYTNNYAGTAPGPCSICDCGGGCGGPYPTNCWPPLAPISPCNNSINYAPDQDHLDHTPIRYIKVVIHVFQKEDILDPANFTVADIAVMEEWFGHPDNSINAFLGNLCDDPTDGSDWMKDARIQFLWTATEGEDLFFYRDDLAWGTGYSGCGFNGSPAGSYSQAVSLATASMANDEIRDAYHILLTGGKWIDSQSTGTVGSPDPSDCYWLCPTGFTTGMQNCPPPNILFANMAGWYHAYTTGACQGGFPVPGSQGVGILGEFLHLVGIDHLHQNQAHIDHALYDDSCEDTPPFSVYNKMNCEPTGQPEGYRCALTRCQLGRAHYTLTHFPKNVERFPIDNNGNFSRTARNCYITEPDIVIEDGEDIIWQGSRNLRSNILVETGSKLTITCDVGFPENARITVETGARLYIDGARLYNNCTGDYWHGIEIQGDPATGQLPWDLTGYARIFNGATIEMAKFIGAKDGGVLRAFDSEFINCGKIHFYKYGFNNLSRLDNCDFVRDGNYGLPVYLYPQVFMQNTKGILITSCEFVGYNPGNVSNNTAVVGESSKFTVTGTTVKNYYQGVAGYAGIGSPQNFTVKNSILDANQHGTVSWGVNNAIFQNNLVEGIGDYDNDYGDHRGLYLRNCTGYTAKDNTFFGGTGSNRTTGVYAYNTGSESNEIKRDTFENLYAANRAELDNKGLEVEDGLQYLCNNNVDDNTFDFLVFDEGVAASQGGGEATKNLFSYFNTAFGDFNNQSTGPIDYYYKNVTDEIPVNYLNILPISVNDANDCTGSGDDEDTVLTPTQEGTLVQGFTDAHDSYDTLRSHYLSLLNGGISENSLRYQVTVATSGQAASLKQSLLSYSPYLTTAVLETVVSRDDIFSGTDIKDILAANPDELRAPAFQDFLYAEVGSTLADTILAYKGQTTARTAAEAALTRYKMTMHRTANRILKSLMADTTGLDLVKYRKWLSNKGSLEAEYERVGTYVLVEDYDTARLVRDSMPDKFGLDGDALSEHLYYVDFTEIVYGALEDSIHYSELDSATVLEVQDIAGNSTGLAGTLAQGILNLYYGYDYEVTPKEPEGEESLLGPPGSSAVQVEGQKQPLTAVPNPATKEVTFHCRLEEGIGTATLIIYDLDGRAVQTFMLEESASTVRWDAEGRPEGIYYCQLLQPGKEPSSLKLILIK